MILPVPTVASGPGQAPTLWSGQADSLFTTVKVRRGQTLSQLFGKNWELVSRINRIDPRALRVGTKLKVPLDWEWAKTYSPAPDTLPQAAHLRQFVLIDLNGQYLATYEHGKQRAWYPISSGMDPDSGQTPHWYIRAVVRLDSIQSGRTYKDSLPDLSTPTGLFRAIWKDSTHTSSAFFTIDSATADSIGAPMPWAVNFKPAYWTHGTGNKPHGLPGYPASHGCVRMFDKDAEAMYRWIRRRTFILIVKNAAGFPRDIQALPPPDSVKQKTP